MPRTTARAPPGPPPLARNPAMDLRYGESYATEATTYADDSYGGAYDGRMPPLPPLPRPSAGVGAGEAVPPTHRRHQPPAPPPREYHPYARPGATQPYGEPAPRPPHPPQPYGYEYYDESYAPASHRAQQRGGPHRVDPSPMEDVEGVVRPPPVNLHTLPRSSPPRPMQPMQPALIRSHPPPPPPPPVATSEVKKPPRPYTEYNIFFQLERERILGDLLEDQQRKKDVAAAATPDDKAEDEPKVAPEAERENRDDAAKDSKDKKNDKGGGPKADGKGKDGGDDTPSDKGKGDDEVEIIAPKQGVVLNRPSDANDVLPRPARFAHLTLSPLWYDSTHRLAQSKLNKSRRKHRKTHGLVGFLDLTRRIAKAWSAVDGVTKGYCKRVADRQLKIYKEELKMMKKRKQVAVADGAGGVVAHQGGEQMQARAQQQMMMRMRESAAAASAAAAAPPAPPPISYGSVMRTSMGQPRGHPNHDVAMTPHPPPPPPPAPSAHHGPYPGYNKYWQHQQQPPHPHQHQQYAHPQSYPHQQTPHHQQAPHHHHRGGHVQPQSPYYPPPAIPPLTPTSEYADERGGGYYGEQAAHTPLDELMHRRKLYGAKSLPRQSPPRRRAGAPMHDHAVGAGRKNEEEEARDPPVGTPRGVERGDGAAGSGPGAADGRQSYLSPADAVGASPDDAFGEASTAITPSPSRKHEDLARGASAGSSGPGPPAAAPGSLTPSQLPVKKRRKKLEGGAGDGAAPTPCLPAGDGTAGGGRAPCPPAGDGRAPCFRERPAPSPAFALSPSGLMTPGGTTAPFQLGASPPSGGSYRKALGPYLNDDDEESSPFPYIDWGSPQEYGGSPRDGGSSPRGAGRECYGPAAVPPHLGVPGPYPRHPPPPTGGHPPPHYPHPSSHHPSSHPASHRPSSRPHPGARYPPPPGYPPVPSPYPPLDVADLADEDVLDLDDEEMQVLWRRLAAHTRRKRTRERDAAAAWMSYYGGGTGGSFAASPGGGGMGTGMGTGMGSHLRMAHSFSSPMERPEVAAGGGGGAAGAGGGDKFAGGGGCPGLPDVGAAGASAGGSGEDETEKNEAEARREI